MGRLLLLALVVAAFGVASGSAFAASSESERTASAANDARPAQSCGPCPTPLFAKGRGSGRVEVWHEWKDGSSSKTSECRLPAGGSCTVDIDDEATAAYLRAFGTSGSTFVDWERCPDERGPECRVSAFGAVSLCAVFTVNNEPVPASPCPPPSVQLWKKGNGEGTVTTTNSTRSRSESCGSGALFCLMSAWAFQDTLTMSASPAAGSVFVRWDGCPAVQPDNTCRFSLTTATVICSVFVKAGSAAPSDRLCPSPAMPPASAPKPPRLGSKCTIPGSPYGERLTGTGGNDVLCGRGGNDHLNGRGGHDLVLGGRGSDRIGGQAGNDRLRGGAGRDSLNGGAGTDILEGGTGNDVITSRGDRARDTVTCGRGRDLVYADRLDRVARDCERVRRR